MSDFQSGLVPIYHLSGGKINTWDPVAMHTLTQTFRLLLIVKVVLEETEFYLLVLKPPAAVCLLKKRERR